MTNLEQFLDHNVEGYLFGDLATMKAIVVQGDGACGYPMLMTTFAGIELLGALLSQDKFNRDSGQDYFRNYWQNHLYTQPPAQKYADPLYQIVRHGIAHGFATWGPVHVYKDDRSRHLVEDTSGDIYISANTIADDLIASYTMTKEKLTTTRAPATRLSEMMAEQQSLAGKHLKPVRKHALPAAPTDVAPNAPSGPPQAYATSMTSSVPPLGGVRKP